jgi:hypothetical protein
MCCESTTAAPRCFGIPWEIEVYKVYTAEAVFSLLELVHQYISSSRYESVEEAAGPKTRKQTRKNLLNRAQ